MCLRDNMAVRILGYMSSMVASKPWDPFPLLSICATALHLQCWGSALSRGLDYITSGGLL